MLVSDTQSPEAVAISRVDFDKMVSYIEGRGAAASHSQLAARARVFLMMVAAGYTLHEIGEHFGISAERVRQLYYTYARRLRSHYGPPVPKFYEDGRHISYP